ncbi:MGMT family protein [Lentibacillus sediminis]|uniref:MGMT family protein n=1 Tax=Lentibacillus sediminis TaxID=1940529 RepID=UPI000C1BA756|nr:MGMT family protein [Lentibacillus sediminis]
MQPFTEDIITVIRKIPAGKVMTYGQISRVAGHPRGARQVARILHSMSRKHHLPWHRVINAKGEIALKDEIRAMDQRIMLEDEGVEVTSGGRVDLGEYQFLPDARE